MKSSLKQKGKRLISRRICGVMLICSLLVRKSGVRSSTCSLFFENESSSKCKITVMQNLINPGLRPKPQPQGPNPRPQGSNPRFKTPIKTLNLNPSLEAQIPACKPIFQPSYPYPKSEPQDSSPSAKHRSSDPSGPADQYQALTPISQPRQGDAYWVLYCVYNTCKYWVYPILTIGIVRKRESERERDRERERER